MKKPTMLYASPFWPVKSGISNYSSHLLQALKKYFTITLLTDGYGPEDERCKEFPVIRYKKGEVYEGQDVILYNIGNQPDYHSYMLDAMENNPGYIILHDFSLYYLTVGVAQRNDRVFSEIYKHAGIDGIQLVKDSLREKPEWDLLLHKALADKLPMNRGVLESAKGILVHSHYAERCIREMGVQTDICCVNHLMTDMPVGNMSPAKIKKTAKEKWDIPEDAFVLVAAGFIGTTKQNVLTCKAVGIYNASHKNKIYYLMAGDGPDADPYLDTYIKKTGFLPDDLYTAAIRRADVIMNLRYPTNGETSGTMIQGMQLGKPCVTTAIGWFDELPDDAVIKLSPAITAEELAARLDRLDMKALGKMGARAREYIRREYDPDKIARQIKAFLTGR